MFLNNGTSGTRRRTSCEGLSLLVVVLVVLTALGSPGRNVRAQESNSEREDTQRPSRGKTETAVQAPLEGETRRFEEKEVFLRKTVSVLASNVSILGRPDGTRVHCPRNGSAFVFRGRNVVLMHLEFTGCANGSAIAIADDDSPALCHGDEQPGCTSDRIQEPWKPAVRVVSCSFSNNKNSRGAAILITYGRLLVDHSRFQDNEAAKGGAIYAVSSRVRVKDSYFESNSAGNSKNSVGGAVASFFSVVTVENTTFVRNEAVMGGALWMKQATIALKNSHFSRNAARIVGGGCALLLSDVSFQNVAFVKCNATMGAALWMRNSTGTVVNANVTGNLADRPGWGAGLGGGFHMWNSTVMVKGINFDDNSADKGGALYLANSTVTARNVSVFRNNATASGGGFAMYFSDTKMVSIKLKENIAAYGGALTVQESTAAMKTIQVSWNKAQDIGGAFHLWQSSVGMKHAKFLENTAKFGGAVWMRNSSTTLQFVDCIGNDVDSSGGAFEMLESRATASDSNFRENSARRGGAFRMSKSSAEVTNAVFSENEVSSEGGAIKLSSSDVVLLGGKCVRNRARRGGALCAEKSYVKGTDVIFSDNRASFSGGAVELGDNSTLDARGTLFQKNSGKHGGAIYSKSKGDKVVVADVAFKNNTGEKGGAVCLMKRGKLSSRFLKRTSTTFKNNVAEEGGALYCVNCELDFHAPVQFDANWAKRSGGGIHVEAAKEITFACVRCTQNVAPLGGALAIIDCNFVAIKGSSDCSPSFTDNVAVKGGAFYVHQPSSNSGTYKVINSTFASNRALASIESLNGSGEKTFQKRLDRLLEDSRSRKLELPDCTRQICGRGGAGYFEMLEAASRRTMNHWCPVEESNTIGCGVVEYNRIRMKDNRAANAGGGIFMSGAQNPYSLCRTVKSLTAEKDKQRNRKCFILYNNAIEDGGYGRNFGTEAAFLRGADTGKRFTNLRSGGQLGTMLSRALDNRSESPSKSITINVTDALNQTITTGPDSSLYLELKSNWTVAGTRYKASDGVFVINSTTILGVAVSDTIIFQTDDERKISYSLDFATAPCKDGELADENGLRCRSCSDHLYTLAREHKCRPCETHAICSRTTALVPKAGYWHSTPFSPLMRRCPVEKACSSENRIEKLTAYYKDFDLLLEKMEMIKSRKHFEVSQAEYPQCVQGYTGILCGECRPGYGRDSAGECVRCDQSLALTRITITAVTLLLFGVVSVKLLLAINDVQKTVAFELEQEEKRIREVLDRTTHQNTCSGVSRTGKNDVSLRGGEVSLSVRQKSGASTSDRRPREAEKTGSRLSADSKGEGSSARTLQRTEECIEEPRGVSRDEVSADAMQAARILSETYQVLFNYVQLNSLAFFLGVDWKEATSGLLATQVLTGRLLAVGVYPLGCGFADRDDDVNVPNTIAVLLLRLAFPWLTLVFYAVVVKVWSSFRKDQEKSKYAIDIVPPLRLVFCVVYFAYFVDINSDLIRLLDCVELLPAPTDHDYSVYEILEAGRVWTQDTSLDCWKGPHLWLVVFAVLGLVTSFVFLVSVAIILHKGKKHRRLQNPTFRLQYGFLFMKYKSEGIALYWELVINARRLLAAAVTVYVQSRETTNAEIGLLALIVFLAIILQEIVKPFKVHDSGNTFPMYVGGVFKRFGSCILAEKWATFNQSVTLNSLESASLFMSLSFFLTAVSVNDEGEGVVQEYILISTCFSLNVVFMAFMFYRMWYGLHHYLDINARDQNLRFQGKNDAAEDRNTWLYKKAWTLFFKPQTETPEFDAAASYRTT